VTTKTQSASIAAREQRLVTLTRMLAEGRAVKDYAQETGISYKTAKKDWKLMQERMQAETGEAVVDYRQQQLDMLNELRTQLTAPGVRVSVGRRVELMLSIIDREIRLLGTEAPKKVLINAQVSQRKVEELRVVVGELDENGLLKVIAYAQKVLSGEEETGRERTPGVEWLPAVRVGLDALGDGPVTPKEIIGPDPEPYSSSRQHTLPTYTPPPVIDAEPVLSEDEAWAKRWGDLTK
jgi:hypothetical protein